MIRKLGVPVLALAVILLAVLASTALSVRAAAPPEKTQSEGPEVSPAAAGLLALINNGNEQALRRAPGLRSDVVDRILAHRASGSKFTNLLQLRNVTRIGDKDLADALAPYQAAEDQKAFEAQRKPVPEPGASGKAGGRLRRGDEAPPPAAGAGQEPGVRVEGQGPIALVRPGFYGKLPGYEELDKIDPVKRTEFLETINREMCSCGCKNETLAFCLVNDPGCPVVKARVRKIYDDILAKPR